jgi:hypothetical protein
MFVISMIFVSQAIASESVVDASERRRERKEEQEDKDKLTEKCPRHDKEKSQDKDDKFRKDRHD